MVERALVGSTPMATRRSFKQDRVKQASDQAKNQGFKQAATKEEGKQQAAGSSKVRWDAFSAQDERGGVAVAAGAAAAVAAAAAAAEQ